MCPDRDNGIRGLGRVEVPREERVVVDGPFWPGRKDGYRGAGYALDGRVGRTLRVAGPRREQVSGHAAVELVIRDAGALDVARRDASPWSSRASRSWASDRCRRAS